VEGTDNDKHFSLLIYGINYALKKFHKFVPCFLLLPKPSLMLRQTPATNKLVLVLRVERERNRKVYLSIGLYPSNTSSSSVSLTDRLVTHQNQGPYSKRFFFFET